MKKVLLLLAFVPFAIVANAQDEDSISVSEPIVKVADTTFTDSISEYEQLKTEIKEANSLVKKQKAIQRLDNCTTLTSRQRHELSTMLKGNADSNKNNKKSNAKLTTLGDLAFYTFSSKNVVISFDALTFTMTDNSMTSSGTYSIVNNVIYLTYDGGNDGKTETLKGNGPKEIIYNNMTLKKEKKKNK